MTQSPPVSIIIGTCQRQSLALDCIESILQNDFKDFEILVIDQDSNDGLEVELGRRYVSESRIKCIHSHRVGLSYARNVGVQHARGDILIFADDDIIVDPGWVRGYVEAFRGVHPPPAIVAGRLDPLWLCPKPRWIPPEKEYLLGIYDRDGHLRPMPETELPIGASFAVLRQVILEIGTFDERLGYSYARRARLIGGEDSLLALRAKRANYAIYYQPSAQAWHRISQGKLSIPYFLRRTFWDGVTLVIVMYLSGTANRETAPSIIRWHLRALVAFAWRLFVPRDKSAPAFIGWMRTCTNTANSLGIILAASRLWLKGKLP